jgi:hypothetical protein
MSNKKAKEKLKQRIEKDKIEVAGMHKLPCPVCDIVSVCCIHCNHKQLFGK